MYVPISVIIAVSRIPSYLINYGIKSCFQVPIIIPYLVLVISVYLIIGPILDKPTIEYLYATLFILGGMVFYVPFVHYKLRIPFMGKFALNVHPSFLC